jgi:hypothetical protein
MNEMRDPFSSLVPAETNSQLHIRSVSPHQFRTPLQPINENNVRPPLNHLVSTTSVLSDGDTCRNSQSQFTRRNITSELDLKSVMDASFAIQEGPEVRNILVKLVNIMMQTAGANYGCIMLRGNRQERNLLYIEVIGRNEDVNTVDHQPMHEQTDTVPRRLCEYVSLYTINGRAVARLGEHQIRNGETVASNYKFDAIYGQDPYFTNKSPASILCMPIAKLGGLVLCYTDDSLVSRESTCESSISG